jgi:hypothetical protein
MLEINLFYICSTMHVSVYAGGVLSWHSLFVRTGSTDLVKDFFVFSIGLGLFFGFLFEIFAILKDLQGDLFSF